MKLLPIPKANNQLWDYCRVICHPDIKQGTRFCLICSKKKFDKWLQLHNESPTQADCEEYDHWLKGDGVQMFSQVQNFKKHLSLLIHVGHPISLLLTQSKLAGTKQKIENAESVSHTRISQSSSSNKKPVSVASKQQQSLADAFAATKDEQDISIVEFLLESGIPFNATTGRKCQKMVQTLTGNSRMTLPSRVTFNTLTDGFFSVFAERLWCKLATTTSSLLGLPFMNIIHDMWTNSSKDGILGCTIAFIDSNFVLWTIPVLATQNNFSHSSADMADQMKVEMFRKYAIDVNPVTRFLVSDTTNSAKNVADHFDDVLQRDCDMHVLNLMLQYLLGMKENTANRRIVTVGGAFETGCKEIKSLCRIAAYFGTPQRLTKLIEHMDSLNMAYFAPIVDGETRVAFAMALIKRLFYLFAGFRKFFNQPLVKEKSFKDMKLLFETIDWNLLAEMEGINSYLCRLALGESQQAGVTASYNLYYRIQGLKSVCQDKFLCLQSPPTLIRDHNNEDNLQRSIVNCD